MVSNQYKFFCSGDFSVDANLDRIYDSVGNVVGFKLSDGRVVKLAISLEVGSLEGDSRDEYFNYVTNEDEMDELGLGLNDYEVCEFILKDE